MTIRQNNEQNTPRWMVILPGIAVTLALNLAFTLYNVHRLDTELKSRPKFEQIDSDEVADLTAPDGKIFLADKTPNGVVYRPLNSSDRYRIQM